MTEIFLTVLNMSITAGIVALAVMLVRIPLRKAPKIFSYALWGVVLFRLLFPFSIESPFSLMPENTNTTQNIILRHTESPGVQGSLQFAYVSVEASSYYPAFVAAAETDPARVMLEIAAYVWIIGFIALLGYAAMGYISLKRRVCFATLVRNNIYESDNIKTPFVLGFCNPKIYFPCATDPAQYEYILKHEQTHIKRRDYIIKPFAYAVLALHWFNPLIWVSYILMSKDMEMSCDEAVLKKTDADIRNEYSTSLLNLAVERGSLLNPAAFTFGGSGVKARVANVLNYKKSARWVNIVAVITVAVFLVGFSSDRILAVEIPSVIHRAESAKELGLSILNEHFSIFKDDWGAWENPYFTMRLYENAIWTNSDGSNARYFPRYVGGGGTHRLNQIFSYTVDAETGSLLRAGYSVPSVYIMTSRNPFAVSIEEARNTYVHDTLPFEIIHDEYRVAIIEHSLEFLEKAGFATDEVVFANATSIIEHERNPSVTVSMLVEYANGRYAVLYYWVSEEYFVLAYVGLHF